MHLLLLVATTSIFRLSSTLNLPAKRQYSEVPVKSGNYLIYDCGANATTVEDELDLLWGYLQDAIADVKAPSTSAAFNAFFKANGDKSMVQKVMKNIADGAAVQMISSFFGETTGTPAIFCYNRNESPPAPVDINNVVSVWRKLTVNVCDDRKRIASWWKSEAWFALCEKYWAKPVEPPVGACFEPDPGQTAFSRNGADIRETRVYTLLHESAHYYIQAATQSNNLIDVYTVDDVIDLTADEARMNAMNYVYYVYSVVEECFTNPKVHHPARRRLQGGNLADLVF